MQCAKVWDERGVHVAGGSERERVPAAARDLSNDVALRSVLVIALWNLLIMISAQQWRVGFTCSAVMRVATSTSATDPAVKEQISHVG